jgi:hypothetical protein
VSGASSFETFVGAYNPLTSDSGFFNHGELGTALTSPTSLFVFTDYWVFDINPAGNASTNVNFLPAGTVTDFTIGLYAIGAGVCAGAPVFNTACAGVTTSGLALGFAGPADNPTIGFTGLAAGRYVIVVNGKSSDSASLYSGQLSTRRLPEPGTLALVGVALLGVGGSLRKRKAS